MEKCALTDDGKTIGSYAQKLFRVVVDPYLHVRYPSDNRLSSS